LLFRLRGLGQISEFLKVISNHSLQYLKNLFLKLDLFVAQLIISLLLFQKVYHNIDNFCQVFLHNARSSNFSPVGIALLDPLDNLSFELKVLFNCPFNAALAME
jgi:hypothetical protein